MTQMPINNGGDSAMQRAMGMQLTRYGKDVFEKAKDLVPFRLHCMLFPRETQRCRYHSDSRTCQTYQAYRKWRGIEGVRISQNLYAD